jgi:riboflavin kinase/FMN adenylyltransferase
MPIVYGFERVQERHRGAAVTLGNFDGVHLGHQKIVARLREAAHGLGAKSLAITFEPHPMKVLAPERAPRLLTPPEEKARLLMHYGVDYVLFINFTREFAGLMPEDFVRDVLVGRLDARAVVVGHGYAFGKGKRGTTELLRKQGEKYGFEVEVVRSAVAEGDVVSSSRVRALIARGSVAQAAALLGRHYSIHGMVVRGAGRGGSVLGTPTANISTPNELVPKEGVYAVRVALGGRLLDGVANIGTNPTFGAAGMSYEVHMLGFEGDVLGQELRVHFIKRLRGERAFPGPEALRAAIAEDIEAAREALALSRLPAV